MRTVVVAVVGLTIAAAVAWVAAEGHYRGCVEAAVARHPDPVDRMQLRQEIRTGEVQQQRIAAVDGCSRLP
jgi:hypothetical protein